MGSIPGNGNEWEELRSLALRDRMESVAVLYCLLFAIQILKLAF